MMRNVRGAYMNFEHDRAADWDWLRKWQPNVIRYMGGGSWSDPNSFDVNRVRRIHETCPDATILLRCWEVDDNNFAAHDAMVADPRGTAERQVDWWTRVIDRAGAVGVPRDLLMAGLNNETGPEKDASLYPYTESALGFATPRAVRLGVLVFSVGRPSLAGESQYDIPYFSRLDNAVIANKGAILLHQYMQPEGMYAVWTDAQGNERKDYGYLIGRDLHWQVKAPIIIAEWGIDGIIYNRHPDPKYGNSGWRNFKAEWPPSRYADEYVACVTTCNDNVIATCPFLSDFSDHKWQSFDMLDAYEEFLARKDRCVREPIAPPTPDTPPVTVHLPSVGTGPTPIEEPKPMTTGIIDPRVAQAILAIESGGRSHGADGRLLIRFENHIFKGKLGNDALYNKHFRHGSPIWTGHQVRWAENEAWQDVHKGPQDSEWAAFSLALQLNPDAAYQSISMGAAQIMGFNAQRVGYPNAKAMFDSFKDAKLQTIAFINFFLSDPGLFDAMRRKDWREIAKRYNGAGAVDTYAPLLKKAYEELA